MRLYLNYTFFLFFVLMIAFSVITLADDNKIVCLKSDKIRSVDFKKDYMIFEMQKRDKYNITCKGSGYLNFENPVIIEPQKMGNKICSNDVLKLRNKTCFIDKIELVKKDPEEKSQLIN